MANTEIRIPQLGEGLQEARIVRFLKEPGDAVSQDEIIYEMETDKAVMEIESPVSGRLTEWCAAVDDVVLIGAVVCKIDTDQPATTVKTTESIPAPVIAAASTSSTFELCIPQLGEGLQEARIVRFLKSPGDAISKDELIYEMETDKAVMEIESPVEGVLASWTAEEDTVLNIGAVVGIVNVAAAVTSAPQLAASSGPIRNGVVPPRTRTYAENHGVSEEVLLKIAATVDRKLMPEHIDAYLSGASKVGQIEPAQVAPTQVKQGPETFTDSPLPAKQKTLNFRLQRSAQTVVAATMEMAVDWSAVEAARLAFKAAGNPATQFMIFAYCVAQASAKHPRFRSALVGDATLREYDHLHLGIAVALPGDILLMARITNADTYSFSEFTANAQTAIDLARSGKDQTTDVMQLSLTNMASAGIRTGYPVVVAPSVGTLFVGAPYDEAYPLPDGGVGFKRLANMVFTFDHRVANGIGAARFLADIRDLVENFKP